MTGPDLEALNIEPDWKVDRRHRRQRKRLMTVLLDRPSHETSDEQNGGKFGGPDDARAECEYFISETSVDGPGRNRVDVEGPVAFFLRDGFHESNYAGLRHAVGRKLGTWLSGAATGEANHLGPAGREGEEIRAGPDRKVGAVQIRADRGGPAFGIGGKGTTDFALQSGGRHEGIDVRPGLRDFSCGAFKVGPFSNVAPGKTKSAGVPHRELRLFRTGQPPHVVAAGQQPFNERAPNALASVKELVNDAPLHPLHTQLAAERDHFVKNLHHANGGIGIEAFLAKKPPRFE